MKGLFKFAALAFLVLMLTACGSEGDTKASGSGGEEQKSEEASSEENSSESKEDEPEIMTKEENKKKDAQVGDTVKSEAGEQTMVSRTDDVGTFESGPMKLTIKKVNGVSGTLKGQAAEMMGTKEIEYIQVDMKVSNTSDKDINFFAGQATMTTNTGEQIEPEMLMSDQVGGEFLGKVNKEGSVFYILKNSKAKDVTSVTLHFDGSSNANFETIGDPLEIDVELKQ